MVHLVTGFAGSEHIQSEDDGAFNASFFGEGQFVMEQGSEFEASIIDNNTVRVLDGNGLMYGRHFRVKPNTFEDMIIETGTAGTNRMDLIVVTYEKNPNDGTETAFLQVIKGTETVGTPSAPVYVDDNILEGATFNQMPLYKVTIEGVVLSSIEAVFEKKPTYKTLAEEYEAKFQTACDTYLDSLDILDSMEEIDANTMPHMLTGALATKELNNNLAQCCEWKYLGYKQGKAIFTLPENWHELCVYVSHNGNIGGTLIIPRVLTNSKQFFSQMDWKNTSQNVFTWFRVNITQTSISLYDSFVDGTSDVNTAYVWVLYR